MLWLPWHVLLAVLSHSAGAQSTRGLISGQVRTRIDNQPVAGAWVFYCRLSDDGDVQNRGSARTNSLGLYSLPFLTPGTYRLRAQLEGSDQTPQSDCFSPPSTTPGFQAPEKDDLTLPVAGRLLVDSRLRPPKGVWDYFEFKTLAGMTVRGRCPDMKSIAVDTAPDGEQTAGATLSYVSGAQAIANLPLDGRYLHSALRAPYGRGTPPDFPSLAPLDESPARLQLILRLSF